MAKAKKKKDVWLKKVSLTITCCVQCPHCETGRTPRSGYAEDYFCNLAKTKKTKDNPHGYRVIAGYVEWPSEEPQRNEIPLWCPLAQDD